MPNPAIDKVTLLINTWTEGEANISVRDVAGRVLFQQVTSLQKGVNNTNLPIADRLSSGLYFIRTEVNGESFVRKLIIKKE